MNLLAFPELSDFSDAADLSDLKDLPDLLDFADLPDLADMHDLLEEMFSLFVELNGNLGTNPVILSDLGTIIVLFLTKDIPHSCIVC